MLRGNAQFRIQSEISAAISTLTAGVRGSLAIVAARFLKGIVFSKLVWKFPQARFSRMEPGQVG